MHLFKTKRDKIGHALQLNQYAESDIILVAKVLLLKINLIVTRAEKIFLHLFDQGHDRLTAGKLWTVSSQLKRKLISRFIGQNLRKIYKLEREYPSLKALVLELFQSSPMSSHFST